MYRRIVKVTDFRMAVAEENEEVVFSWIRCRKGSA